MPELPEVEITARLIGEAVAGARVESTLAPGINAVKTFDPPLHALDGASFLAQEPIVRRGKQFALRFDNGLVVLLHLMSAGRLQLFDRRAGLRDRTSRVLWRLDDGRELRLREFGTKQAAWVKTLRGMEAIDAEESVATLGPEAWPDPPPFGPLLRQARPLHTLLRDQRTIAGIGRSWVDEILWQARLSPFKRGRGPERRRGSGAAHGDGRDPRRRDRPLRRDARAAAAGQTAAAAEGPSQTGRALPLLRRGAEGRSLRGLRDRLLPARADRRQGAEGPAPVETAEVARILRRDGFASVRKAEMIETGEKAPEFTLPDQDGNDVSLSDFAGKTVVLYFYPARIPLGAPPRPAAFATTCPTTPRPAPSCSASRPTRSPT